MRRHKLPAGMVLGLSAWLSASALLAGAPTPAPKRVAGARPRVSFPYVGRILAQDVYVRSGPGRNYYRTGKLQKGDEVVVVREEVGGWLAIVPPQGSFNWMSARYIDAHPDGVGTVTGSNVRVRVGTTVSTVRDIYHQQLKRGARVRVLERRDIAVGNATEAWYRIAPPPGEMRWVSAKYVAHVKPFQGSLDEAYGAISPRGQGAAAPTTQGSGAQGSPGVKLYHEARQEIDRIQALDLKEWRFATPRTLCQRILTESADEDAKALARSLLRKIAELEKVKARYDRIATAGRQTDRQIASLAAKARQQQAATQPTTTPFDGTGMLRRTLIDFDGGKIRYKLTRPEDTHVIYFLESPKIDLTPYENRRIGVRGRLRFRRDLDSYHIVVEDVKSLK